MRRNGLLLIGTGEQGSSRFLTKAIGIDSGEACFVPCELRLKERTITVEGSTPVSRAKMPSYPGFGIESPPKDGQAEYPWNLPGQRWSGSP